MLKTAWYGLHRSQVHQTRKEGERDAGSYLDIPSFFYCGRFQDLTGPLLLDQKIRWSVCDVSGFFLVLKSSLWLSQ